MARVRVSEPEYEFSALKGAALAYASAVKVMGEAASAHALAKAAVDYAVALAEHERDKQPPRLSDKVVTLLIDGVKTTGSWNPEETMVCFEEHLTFAEHDDVRGFMAWINEDPKARTCGWGNIQQRFAEYKSASAARRAE